MDLCLTSWEVYNLLYPEKGCEPTTLILPIDISPEKGGVGEVTCEKVITENPSANERNHFATFPSGERRIFPFPNVVQVLEPFAFGKYGDDKYGSQVAYRADGQVLSFDSGKLSPCFLSILEADRFDWLAANPVIRLKTFSGFEEWAEAKSLPPWLSRIRLAIKDVRVCKFSELEVQDILGTGLFHITPPSGIVPAPRPEDWEEWTEEKQDHWIDGQARCTYITQTNFTQVLFHSFNRWWAARHRIPKWVWVATFDLQRKETLNESKHPYYA